MLHRVVTDRLAQLRGATISSEAATAPAAPAIPRGADAAAIAAQIVAADAMRRGETVALPVDPVALAILHADRRRRGELP